MAGSPAYQTAVTNLGDAQQIELQQAITDLQSNPSQLSSYVSQNQSSLVNSATSQRDNTFQKLYGDMTNASNTQNNIYYYYVRNKDLDTVQQQLMNITKYDADSIINDKDLAQRQYEINQWAYGNKMDTLFIFQMILIGLVLVAPLLYFSRGGFIPTSVLTGTAVLLTAIITLTIAVRAQYTIFSRDQKYWNRKQFDRQGGPPIPVANACTVATAGGSAAAATSGPTGSNITLDTDLNNLFAAESSSVSMA